MDAQLATGKMRLRQAMRRAVESISPSEAREAGQIVSDHLTQWSAWQRTSTLALFASLPGEVDTRPLIERAQSENKTLLFPRMRTDRTLEFAVVSESRSLAMGRYGVLEPDHDCRVRSIDSVGLVLVPGHAFDRTGGRLGRGAGYYDRSLAKCGEVPGRSILVGVAFACQVVDHVPMDSLDVRMDAIVTEAGLFERE